MSVEELHPFGVVLRGLLGRKGYSQGRLVRGVSETGLADRYAIAMDDRIVSQMCRSGKHMAGATGRRRVLAVIHWLQHAGVLTTLDEANSVLQTAGLAGLNGAQPDEMVLIHALSQQQPPPVIVAPPPARSIPNNLPIQLTSFIGREEELHDLQRLLAAARLVTLVGAGGVGKTRLAQQLAMQMQAGFMDGVWLVELAPLSDAALVPQTVAQVLRLPEQPGISLLDLLVRSLQSKYLLLVLDNCEHLVDACARLVDLLLRSCSNLRILATSREPLRVMGEAIYHLPPLAFPESDTFPTLDRVTGYAAIRLFAERAQAAQASFAVTQANVAAVIQICRRLDGIPLAIELAAARVAGLPVEQLAARLDDRFRLLTGGSRTVLPRHQTLRELIAWSYALLSEPERIVLRRLAVFAGRWTVDAAEVICSGDSIDRNEVLPVLLRLVDKSLVVSETQDGQGRYRMLETIRQYAQEQLEASGEEATVRQRHLRWFLHLAEQPREMGDTLTWIATEYDNLRAALDWVMEHDPEPALRLATQLYNFWLARGYISEGTGWLEMALARGTSAPVAVRAQALFVLGKMFYLYGSYERSQIVLEECLALMRELGDTEKVSLTLSTLASSDTIHGGDYARAARRLEVSLSLAYKSGSTEAIAYATLILGTLEYHLGNYGQARIHLEESQAGIRAVGQTQLIVVALVMLGLCALRQGEYQAAGRYFREALVLVRALGYKSFMCSTLERLGALASMQAQPERAARLLAAGEKFRSEVGNARPLSERPIFERSVALARSHLGEERFAAAWSDGQRMSMDEAITYAMQQPETDEGAKDHL